MWLTNLLVNWLTFYKLLEYKDRWLLFKVEILESKQEKVPGLRWAVGVRLAVMSSGYMGSMSSVEHIAAASRVFSW